MLVAAGLLLSGTGVAYADETAPPIPDTSTTEAPDPGDAVPGSPDDEPGETVEPTETPGSTEAPGSTEGPGSTGAPGGTETDPGTPGEEAPAPEETEELEAPQEDPELGDEETQEADPDAKPAPLGAAPSAQRFPDVSPSHRFYEHINWLAGAGITVGGPDGKYGPENPVTRGAMTAFLMRFKAGPALPVPDYATFNDVPARHTFHRSIAWIRDTGIGKGVAGGNFVPGNAVNRGAMAAFLYRAAGSPSFTLPRKPTFTDVPRGHTFYAPIEWLKSTGITAGVTATSYAPDAPVTRGSMAAFLWRFERYAHPGSAAQANGSSTAALTVGARTETSVAVAWKPVSGAKRYRLEWSRSAGGELPRTANFSSGATGARISGLRPNVKYSIRLVPEGAGAAARTSAQTLAPRLLNVATFNVVANNLFSEQPQWWPNRRQAVWDLGNSRRPDVVGLQEAGTGKVNLADGKPGTLSWNVSNVYYEDVARGWKAKNGTPYEIVNADKVFNCVNAHHPGDPRDWNNWCWGENRQHQGASGDRRIAYNPTTVELLEAGSTALEESPGDEIPFGRKGEPDHLAWAKFTQKSTGKRFVFATLHYAVGTQNAQAQTTVAALQEINPEGLPVILTGDFAVTQWDKNFNPVIGTFASAGYKDLLGAQKDTWNRKSTGLGTAYTGRPNCNSTNHFAAKFSLASLTNGKTTAKCSGGSFIDTATNGANVDYILARGISSVPVWETMVRIDNSGRIIGKLPSDHAMLRAEVQL